MMNPPIKPWIVHNIIVYCIPFHFKGIIYFKSFRAIHEVFPYLHFTWIYQPNVVRFYGTSHLPHRIGCSYLLQNSSSGTHYLRINMNLVPILINLNLTILNKYCMSQSSFCSVMILYHKLTWVEDIICILLANELTIHPDLYLYHLTNVLRSIAAW